MKQTRKIIVALLLVLTLMMGVVAISASAADEGTTIYFQNNWLWTDVRCYCFDGETVVGEAWPGSSMELVGTDGGYEVYSYTVPAGTTGLIISGIKNDGSGNRDQTPDITSGISNGAGWCMDWVNNANAVNSYVYDSAAVKPVDPNATPIFTVAGDSELVFGKVWDPSYAANDMSYDPETGVYTLEINNVPSGTYKFKCAQNHTWAVAYGDPNSGDPDGNYVYTVEENDTTLIITLKGTTVSATTHQHNFQVTSSTVTCTQDGTITYTCESCGKVVEEKASNTGHNYVDGVCANCGGAEPEVHEHVYTHKTTTAPSCTSVGTETYTCSCGDTYTEEIAVLTHQFTNGFCSLCKSKDPEYNPEYYLVGYINGADYGCEADSENIGEYKIINGEISVFFEQDSYVFVKTDDNKNWYMTKAYVENGDPSTLYSTNDGGNNKVFVPGGVEVLISVVVNEDNTLTISYEADDPYYTVAGSAGLCGSDWNPADELNDLEMDESDGSYVLTYVDVLAGEYEIKVVRNHDWNAGSFGIPVEGAEAANVPVVVEEDGSIVCIIFDPSTRTVTVEITPPDPVDTPDEPGDEPSDEPGNQPDNEPTDDPTDDPSDEPVEKLNFFQKIWKAIVVFFTNLFASFKK